MQLDVDFIWPYGDFEYIFHRVIDHIDPRSLRPLRSINKYTDRRFRNMLLVRFIGYDTQKKACLSLNRWWDENKLHEHKTFYYDINAYIPVIGVYKKSTTITFKTTYMYWHASGQGGAEMREYGCDLEFLYDQVADNIRLITSYIHSHHPEYTSGKFEECTLPAPYEELQALDDNALLLYLEAVDNMHSLVLQVLAQITKVHLPERYVRLHLLQKMAGFMRHPIFPTRVPCVRKFDISIVN